MIKGTLFTLGVLSALGGLVVGGLFVAGGAMSDAPAAGDDSATTGLWIGGAGLTFGAVACLAAWLLP